MPDSDTPRIYGTPDPDNQTPPAEQGLRGEQGTPEPIRSDLTHEETMPDGSRIEIAEQSGPAFAEVTGKAGGSNPDETHPDGE